MHICAGEQIYLDEISVILMNDISLRRINKQVLNHNFFTDIITFDNRNEFYKQVELCISSESVLENSGRYKTTFTNELNRVFIHGLLHVAGYNDKSEEEKKIIRSKEDYYLELVSRETGAK
jgi:rRNA maturation RNase YbeY